MVRVRVRKGITNLFLRGIEVPYRTSRDVVVLNAGGVSKYSGKGLGAVLSCIWWRPSGFVEKPTRRGFDIISPNLPQFLNIFESMCDSVTRCESSISSLVQ